jgi:hypothetical protein
MEINSQKKTWSNFKKISIYITVAIVATLVLMAIFLL